MFGALCLGAVVWELVESDDDYSLTLRFATRGIAALVGVELEPLVGKRILDVFPAADPVRVPIYAEICRKRFSRDFGRIDGERGAFNLRGVPVLDGAVALILEAAQATGSAEREARQLGRFLDSIVEHIPAMVFMKDAEELRFERFNRAGEQLLGMSRDALLGRSDYDFFPREQADFFVAKDREVLARGKLQDIAEEPIQTASGTRWLHTRKIPLIDEGGRPRHLLGISIDITERKQAEDALRASHEALERLVAERTSALELEIDVRKRTERALNTAEEQLRQSQKMEAIGRLAGGVAHDFNNILSVILSYTSLALETLREHDPLRGDLTEVLRAAERASELTRQLLAFSRRQMLEPRIVDLNSVVTRLDPMLRRMIGEDVALVTETAPDLHPVRVDVNQIEQVVLNLVVNAREAMPQGGKLTLSTRNVALDAVSAQLLADVAPGAYAVVAVSDTGTGMDHETQLRIFEPFFTTKDQSRGSGLGLSMVFGIVKQSGGGIGVESEPGCGTTFRVYLPSVAEPGVQMERRVSAPAPRAGRETVLLVEDEDQVRKVVLGALIRAGYDVLEAADAAAALRIVDAHAGTIDVLVTDVVMPEVSGPELARRLRAELPGLRVLYMSGYAHDAVLRHGVLEDNVGFLQKPVTPDLLLRKVREVLDAG